MSNSNKNNTDSITGGAFGKNKVHFSETERTDGKGKDYVVQSTTQDGKTHITVHPDGTVHHVDKNGKTYAYPTK